MALKVPKKQETTIDLSGAEKRAGIAAKVAVRQDYERSAKFAPLNHFPRKPGACKRRLSGRICNVAGKHRTHRWTKDNKIVRIVQTSAPSASAIDANVMGRVFGLAHARGVTKPTTFKRNGQTLDRATKVKRFPFSRKTIEKHAQAGNKIAQGLTSLQDAIKVA